MTFETPLTGSDGPGLMQAVNDRLSAWVTEHPEQWLWFHRRWRSTLRSRERPKRPAGTDPGAI